MSSGIIYRRLALKFQPAETGLHEPLFVLVAITGASNCTMQVYRNGRTTERLERRWRALAAGTYRTVMREVIEIAMSSYGGSLHVGRKGGYTKGSNFIESTRRLVDASDDSVALVSGTPVNASFCLPEPDKGDGRYRERIPYDGRLREYFALPQVGGWLADGTLYQYIRVSGPDPFA